jgi:hypothetical protein
MRTKEQIAKRNDLFRQTMIRTSVSRVVLTETVASSVDREEIITRVRNFKDFSQDNDPYGEHDLGSFTVNGQKYFFKIDYYDLNFDMGADPYTENYAVLLTIMHASEY